MRDFIWVFQVKQVTYKRYASFYFKFALLLLLFESSERESIPGDTHIGLEQPLECNISSDIAVKVDNGFPFIDGH